MPPKDEESKFDTSYGARSGKTDLERWGIFAEMLYLHGQGMTAVKLEPKGRRGRQMYAGGAKLKTGLQDCYFDKEFKRIFIREAYNSLYEQEAKARLKSKEKFRTPMGFRPPSGNKLHSTPGDFYGTFAGRIDALDPVSRKPDKKKLPVDKKPFVFSSTKKGGYGYVGTTINPYPEYKGDKYDQPPEEKKGKTGPRTDPFVLGYPGGYFDPNPNQTTGTEPATYKKLNEVKWDLHGTFKPPHAGETINSLGGKKSGGFSKYPEYQSEKYIDPHKISSIEPRGKKDKSTPKVSNRPFIPSQGSRSFPVSSIVNRNVEISMNSNNYQTMNPVSYTREFFYDIEA